MRPGLCPLREKEHSALTSVTATSDYVGSLSVGSTLIDAHPFFRKPVAYLLAHLPILSTYVDLPKTYFTSPKPVFLLQPAEAKTCVASVPFPPRIGAESCAALSAGNPLKHFLFRSKKKNRLCSLLLALMLFTSRIVIPTLFRRSSSAARKSTATPTVAQKKQQQKAVAAHATAVADKSAASSGIKQRKAQ